MSALLAVMNRKGGAGRTSATASLAFLLAERGPVTVLDTDPQGSLARQWLREPPDGMRVLHAPKELDAALLSLKGTRGAILAEAPPLDAARNGALFDAASFVLVPLSASPLDIGGAAPLLEALHRGRKRALCVLWRIDSRASTAILSARRTLGKYGVPVAETEVRSRVEWVNAAAEGRGVRGPAREEVESLLKEIEASR